MIKLTSIEKIYQTQKMETLALSNINLNREYYIVAEPHVPVLRALTPVYVNGKLFGLVVSIWI